MLVDIDDVIDIKMRMLHCHKSQVYEWLPWVDGKTEGIPERDIPERDEDRFLWLKENWTKLDKNTADKYRDKLIERYGGERGARVKYAEAFEVSEYGGKLPKDKVSLYFPF